MRFRLALVLALLVTLPLGLLAWLGVRVAGAEQARLSQTFDGLLRGRLEETDNLVSRLLDDRRRTLLKALEDSDLSPASLDRMSRSDPAVIQMFHQGVDGKVLFPTLDGGLSLDERKFLERFQPVFDGKMLLIPESDSRTASAASQGKFNYPSKYVPTVLPPQAPPREGSFGWFPWYWGNDVRLLFWMRRPDGSVAGAELSRSRLLADLIGMIPEPGERDAVVRQGSVALIDSGGRVLFRWGGFSPPLGHPARLKIPLSGCLHSWSLNYQASPELEAAALGSGTAIPLGAGLLAVGLALAGLAGFLYRENLRELREAAQRVSFVNQVSHELKTPLTNIRLHAELLAEDFDNLDDPDDPDNPDDPDPRGEENETRRKRVGVIVSESQRLGRLINNVLTFSRQQRDRIALKPAMAVPDRLVSAILERFRPLLVGRCIQLETSLEAAREVGIDGDALDQILNNLLSNVEKYAAAGGKVLIATRQSEEWTFLLVRDAGPGIPTAQAEFVFQPFARLNDSLTEGVAGAGIGLTLARELARRHGGELELIYSAEGLQYLLGDGSLFAQGGACFLTRLRTPAMEKKE